MPTIRQFADANKLTARRVQSALLDLGVVATVNEEIPVDRLAALWKLVKIPQLIIRILGGEVTVRSNTTNAISVSVFNMDDPRGYSKELAEEFDNMPVEIQVDES
jgi:hypothetical protein